MTGIDGQTLLLSLPSRLWNAYADLLWDPPHGSWVDRSAKTFRVLSFIVISPFIVLTLLDVMSYVIARTLGVVETTRASTSDKRLALAEPYAATGAVVDSVGSKRRNEPEPQLVIEFVDRELQLSSQEPSRSSSANDLGVKSKSGSISSMSESNEEEHEMPPGYAQLSARVSAAGPSSSSRVAQNDRFKERLSFSQLSLPMPGKRMLEPQPYFFSPSDETNLELSGANLSSPAISRDASPSTERCRLELDRDYGAIGSSVSDPTEASFILLERPYDGATLSRRDGKVSSIADSH